MEQNSKKIKKSLFFSLWDGIFASIMFGFTTDYIIPYALALGAKVFNIGILNSLPNLFSSLVQLRSADLTEKVKSRKKIIIIFVFLHLSMLIPIILVPIFFKPPMFFLIIFVTLFNAFNAFSVPSWSSLISEYVPIKTRGRYFSWRSRILGSVVIVSTFSAGFILYLFHKEPIKGFSVIFSIALISRFISWLFLTKLYEPPFRVREEDKFTFLEFIKRIKNSNFAKFTLFVSLLNFSVNLAAPYFSVFMLKDLNFNYLTYTILITIVPLTQILVIRRWGHIADRVGNLKILKFSSLIISTLPFWWIVYRNPIYLGLIQVISGFAWAGFNLCATNFIYDAVSESKRVRCIAYFNFMTGLALCLGSIIGGFLINYLPYLFGYKILTLFFISSIFRFMTVKIFINKIKEVRKVEDINNLELFYTVVSIRPFFGISRQSNFFKEEIG